MSRLAGLEQGFEQRQPRERNLASAAIAVLLVLLLYVVWIEPVSKSAAAQREQAQTLAPQVAAEREALARVQDELSRDPEAARRGMLEQLRGEVTDLDVRLRTDEAAVIQPARMPAVLRDLLGRDARLRVVGVEVLAPEVLRWSQAMSVATEPATDPASITSSADARLPALYRHRVLLRFEGDFMAAIDYVRAVEALPKRVRIESFELEASRWPRIDIVLQVETLGLEEGWIGV